MIYKFIIFLDTCSLKKINHIIYWIAVNDDDIDLMKMLIQYPNIHEHNDSIHVQYYNHYDLYYNYRLLQ